MRKSNFYQIAVVPGDGIGPEIMEQALKVLEATAAKLNCQFKYINLLAGGDAWDRYGVYLPQLTLESCRESDAILFGAVGGPVDSKELKWQDIERQVILGLRKEFDLFANIRPIQGGEVDLVIVRELTSGIYFGGHKFWVEGELLVAEDIMRYTSREIERILRVGFTIAKQRKKKLILVDKANVLETSRLWRRVAEQVKADYRQVELNYMFVDNAAYQLAKSPSQFDVIVTSNMFGDILSDEAAFWVKSLGMIPSASLGEEKSPSSGAAKAKLARFGLYEPAHGSAPKLAGTGSANPLAMILSAALMLRFSFNLPKGAQLIEQAVKMVRQQGYGTPDLKPKEVVSTNKMGDLVAQFITDSN